MRTSRLGLVLSVSMVCMVGCGAGEVVPLDLRAAEPPVTAKPDRVRVAVSVFEDARSDTGLGVEKARIGVRTHLGGGHTYFAVKGGQVGPAVSQVVADYLTKRGLEAWVAGPADQRTADVRLNGRVRECQAVVSSHVGWTELAVRTKVDVDAMNLSDQSSVRMTLDGQGQDVKVVFDVQDLERLLNEAFNDSLKEFMNDTNLANRMLRLK